MVFSERVLASGETERFADNALRVESRQSWSERRALWAERAASAYAANDIFGSALDVQSDMEREAERFELVLGDGILNWYQAGGGINYPLLLQRLQLEYDAIIPEFTVKVADRPPEVNGSLLRAAEVDGYAISKLIGMAEDAGIGPLGPDRNGILQNGGNHDFPGRTVRRGRVPNRRAQLPQS